MAESNKAIEFEILRYLPEQDRKPFVQTFKVPYADNTTVLQGLQYINRIVQSSRSAGMAAAADVNPLLMAKLPLAFKTLGMSVHRDMDGIAHAAEGGQPTPELLKMTSNTLAKCVACHASWQIKAGN
jgi:hypothetical protein